MNAPASTCSRSRPSQPPSNRGLIAVMAGIATGFAFLIGLGLAAGVI